MKMISAFEPLDHLKVDISLQQRQPDLSQCILEVGFTQRPLAAHFLDDGGKLVFQIAEHEPTLAELRQADQRFLAHPVQAQKAPASRRLAGPQASALRLDIASASNAHR